MNLTTKNWQTLLSRQHAHIKQWLLGVLKSFPPLQGEAKAAKAR